MTWEDIVNSEELKVVRELKKRIFGDMTQKLREDESVFYRFSKARDFNLDKAEDMLRKHIEWRKVNNVDAILDEEPSEVLQKYFPATFICFDKEGCVVSYADVGNADVKGVFNSTKKGEVFRYIIRTNEMASQIMAEQSKKLGKHIITGIFIYNHENLTLGSVTDRRALETALLFANAFQDNYPERVKYVFHINASVYFTMGFSVVKRVLASSLLQKIRCYGTEGWKEELLEHIDADVLPAFLGGNRTDPDGDPLCKSFVVHGMKIPRQYYLRKSERSLSKCPGVQRLKVSQLSREQVSVEVGRRGSYLEWEFEVQSGDVAFGLRRKDDQGAAQDLIALHRTDTECEPEKKLYRCDTPGTYTFIFDNSYSWIHSKEVYYRIRIRNADDVEAQQKA